jgi:hypothetical protein
VTLRHQVSVIASAIREHLSIDITNAELRQLSGHSGDWAQGMMARYDQEIQADHRLSCGHSGLVESEQEQALIQFCLSRWAERKPATVEDVIHYTGRAGKEVDRFWVKRFAECKTERLALRQAGFIEEDRCNVGQDNIKAHFDCCRTQLATMPSPSPRTQTRPEWELQRNSSTPA